MSLSLPLIALGALALFALGWFVGRSSSRRALSGRSAPMRSFTELGPAIRAEIESAIAQGHKIEAIKLLREATGMGLKESKEAVEAMERR